MFNTEKFKYHPLSEKLANHLSTVTQNPNKHFFRVMLTYYFGMLASHMRVGVHGWGESTLPLNIYAICLSESGTGKGYTMNTMNDRVLHKFRDVFLEETFPIVAEDRLIELAQNRSDRRGTSLTSEEDKLVKEYHGAGEMLFQFSEGTPAAVKQIRHKLCLARAGSLNYNVDEIGSNLLNQKDMINVFLELYDTGRIQDKLVKNTSENQRVERVEGNTPSNVLLTGTSSSLLDGAETENKFYALLETGYARRCFFSFSRESTKMAELSAEDLINQMFNKHANTDMEIIADNLAALADVTNIEKVMELPRDAAVYLMKYKMWCIKRGEAFKEHQKVLKFEMDNRFFKVLKLASIYAFIDMEDEVTITHLNYAIKLAEDSGNDLHKLMTPEKDFMKLAHFLVDFQEGATMSDLDLHLPCFNGTKAKKDEMIANAISWGYKNGVLISKYYVEQILFLKAKTIEETNLDELIVSLSDHQAFNYEPMIVPFEELEDLGLQKNFQWCNHHFEDEHRLEDNTIPGFNVLVLDVDDGTPMSAAQTMFQDYWCIFYETKSSTEDFNRYRIVLPISHVLELDEDDYKQLVNNVISSLPFDIEIDSASNQRSKKWRTCNKGVVFNDVRYVNGKEVDPILFDILPFIPRTTRNEQRQREAIEYESLDNIQRWFIEHTAEGNRNKQLYRYAMCLVDMGLNFSQVEKDLLDFNSKLKEPVPEKELKNTILTTVAKKIK